MLKHGNSVEHNIWKKNVTHLILDFVQLCPKWPKTDLSFEPPCLAWICRNDLRLPRYNLPLKSQQRLFSTLRLDSRSSRACFPHLVHEQRKLQVLVLVKSGVEQNLEVPIGRVF